MKWLNYNLTVNIISELNKNGKILYLIKREIVLSLFHRQNNSGKCCTLSKI